MEDGDEVTFVIEHDKDRTSYLISVIFPKSSEYEDLAACLYTLADDIVNDPENFKKLKIATSSETH